MKVYCSRFNDYEEYARSNKKEKHAFNLQNKSCSCGSTLRYFCETCKVGVPHSSFQRSHRHKKGFRKEDDFGLLFEGDDFTTLFDEETPLKKVKKEKLSVPFEKRTEYMSKYGHYCTTCKKNTFVGLFVGTLENYVWVCQSCEIMEIASNTNKPVEIIRSEMDISTNNMIIAINLDKIRKLTFQFYDTDISIGKFLDKLKVYTWMGCYYPDYGIIRKEILSACYYIWYGELDNGSRMSNVDKYDLESYIELIKYVSGYNETIDGINLEKDAKALLQMLGVN